MAGNMKPMVDSGAAIHVCPSSCGLSLHRSFSDTLVAQKCWRMCCILLGATLKVTCIRVLKFQANYEVALVVRPMLSVDMLITQGAQVVFGVGVNRLYIQLPDGNKIPMIRENGAIVLNTTLVDKRYENV